MRRAICCQLSAVILPALLLIAAGDAAAQSCAGDCDGNGKVTVEELVIGSRIFFGTSPLDMCPATDVDGDGAVNAGDLQSGLIAYAEGCHVARAAALGATAGTANALVTLSTATVSPGVITAISSTLSTMGNPVVALQQDISFSPLTPIVGCAVNPAINKPATAFGFQPPGCSPGVDCTAIRAIVISFTDLNPIPDGSPLFGCSVDVAPSAPAGTYPLTSSNTLAADASGNELPLDGIDGAVIVVIPPTPTPTPATAPASLILERVRLKADTSKRPGRHSGSIQAVAVVNANAPFADLVEDIAASGLSVDLAGAGGVAEVVDWTAAQCTTRSTARGPRVRCVADDGSGFRKIDLRPIHTPNLFKLKLTARDRSFAPPLTADPITATLRTASFARADFIGGCRVGSGGRVSTCRETGFVPTETPTPTATDTPTSTQPPTETPTPAGATRLILSNAVGVSGGTASFTVLLETDTSIAGTENEITLEAGAFISCQVNPATGKTLQYVLRPTGCASGVDCTAMKGIVINFSDLSPIPSGLVLYSCEVAIGATPPGNYAIECLLPGAATPDGDPVPTDCVDGVLTVTGP
jgi:hypothetical protein